MNLLLASTVDVTIVIAIALAAAAILRRRSASLRHGVIAASIMMAAIVPAIEFLGPQWELPVDWRPAAQTSSTLRLTSSAVPEASGAGVTEVAAGPAVSWVDGLMLLWLAGAIVTAGGLLTGLARLARVTRQCTVIDSGPWYDLANEMSQRYRLPRPVVLLQSTEASLLLTWGLFRPKILLPDVADWSLERREVVLAHEIAHIRRSDWALQIAAEVLRAAYWFNPLVWIACRRLRHESEYACDDAVLDAGVEATEYATHLLGVARHAIGHGNAWASAPAIAHPSTLERRISAMLSQQRNREPLTRRAWALAVAGAILVTVPLAAITITERAADPVVSVVPAPDVALVTPAAPAPPPARPSAAPARRSAAAAPAQLAPAAVSGTMQDPSGAVLPGVEVTLTDTQFGVRYSKVSDGAGSFAFPDLQPGRYELEARLPGFATVSNIMTMAAGANVRRTLTLPIGSLEETILVVCSGGPLAGVAVPLTLVQGRGAPPAGSGLPRPIRVGGQIKAPRQLEKVNPICPRTMLPDGDTIINLVARVGVDGYMNEVRHVPNEKNPAPPAEFIESAVEAIRQWKYTPTLLNNQPVDVNVRITVLYRRDTRRA